MTTKIYLPVVDDADPERDSIVRPKGDLKMPLFEGSDKDESLACGACKTVVARHVSTRTFGERFATGGARLLTQCECGAYLRIRVDSRQKPPERSA